MKFLLSLLLYLFPLGAAAGTAYLMWKVLLGWILAQIPVGVSWAFFAKMASIVFVAWFGGIGIPIAILIFGFIAVTGLIAAINA